MTSKATTNEEQDRQEIMRLHNEWYESNCGIDIPRMQKVFAGEKYLMFNLNSHPYYGLSEKTKLWEHYKQTLDIPIAPERRDVRLTLNGDVGWITCEGVLRVKAKQPEGTGASMLPASEQDYSDIPFRSTEIYVRDDGEGNPVWKMWHFHCSPRAPEGEPRPGVE